MPSAHQHHRMLRRDIVEVLAQRQPLLLQLRLMQVAIKKRDLSHRAVFTAAR